MNNGTNGTTSPSGWRGWRRVEDREVRHWKDGKELHRVMHEVPGHLKALLLELLDQPMSREQIAAFVRTMELRMGHGGKAGYDVDADLATMSRLEVIEEHEGQWSLTPGGREIAEHMHEAIPLFMAYLFSPTTVSLATALVHVVLSVLKLVFGLLSRSAGLIADGIDNCADTISSVLVWVGIRLKRDRLVSVFVVLLMFVSVGGIILTAYSRAVDPGPVERGLAAFLISAAAGLVMLLLSAYQYSAGRRNTSFPIMCQSVDSRNHALTSALVCFGIALSFVATRLRLPWLYYADVAASVVIAGLIIRSAVELALQLLKPGAEPTGVSHFLQRAMEKVKAEAITAWLREQLAAGPVGREVLEQRFAVDFCERAPKLFALSGVGYRPETAEDLHRHLDRLVQRSRLLLTEAGYSLAPAPESRLRSHRRSP